MATRAELQAELAKIQTILNSGISSSTYEGSTVNYNVDQLRIREQELRRALNLNGRAGCVRKVIYNPAFRQ